MPSKAVGGSALCVPSELSPMSSEYVPSTSVNAHVSVKTWSGPVAAL